MQQAAAASTTQDARDSILPLSGPINKKVHPTLTVTVLEIQINWSLSFCRGKAKKGTYTRIRVRSSKAA